MSLLTTQEREEPDGMENRDHDAVMINLQVLYLLNTNIILSIGGMAAYAGSTSSRMLVWCINVQPSIVVTASGMTIERSVPSPPL